MSLPNLLNIPTTQRILSLKLTNNITDFIIYNLPNQQQITHSGYKKGLLLKIEHFLNDLIRLRHIHFNEWVFIVEDQFVGANVLLVVY